MNSSENSKVIELYPTNNSQNTFNPFEKNTKNKSEESVKPKKPTYSQDWKAYNGAKTNEDTWFKRLLRELLLLAIEEPTHKQGRKGYSQQDKIFCMAIKIYYKSDLRKTESILKELKNLHLIQKVPCFKSIDNFFNQQEFNEILDKLILISALPLANLEKTGAIDSTGFTTSQFEKWFEYKWGQKQGKERVWRKLHACTGCKTNIFLTAKVTEKTEADAKAFYDVVGDKPKYFDMQDIVADKAYLSREILKFLHDLGLNPYIPFKKNSIGNPKGVSIWRKMFDEFKYNNEEFMNKYHQRSNVETNFHMLKKRFGNNCATKTITAQINEIKTKVLCHNICVLIQEIWENNIHIDFQACVKTTNSV